MDSSFNLLYAADASVLSDENLFAAAYAQASEERKQKTDRYRFCKDQCLSLGAELLLRKALGELGVSALVFSYGKEGKPYLAGKSGLYFSLSHSGDHVLCAVSDHEIGADIETVRDMDLHVAERFFCRSEYEHIAAQESENAKQTLFYRYWTLKESFVKATGRGLYLPFDRFEIILKDEISVIQNADSRCFFFREYGEIECSRCAVCSVDAPFTGELSVIRLRDCL